MMIDRIVETANEMGMDHKNRSTRERSRKLWRFVANANRYPGQTVTGTNPGIARTLPSTWATVMFEPGRS
jgi:hypothetical protein